MMIQRHIGLLVLLLFAASLVSWPVEAAKGARSEHAAASTTVVDKVNINTADVHELMKLKGIGRTVAERIVQYRDTHGPFKSAEDLTNVKGIGPRLMEKHRARIVVK